MIGHFSVVPKFLFNRCPTCKASSEELKAAQQTPQSLLGGECLPCVWTIGAKHSHAWIQPAELQLESEQTHQGQHAHMTYV